MKSLKVALLQILPSDTQGENLSKGIEYCKKAKEMGADIALFPEIWNTGYVISEDMDTLLSDAIDEESNFVQSFGALAKELCMAIGITFLERTETLPKNSLIIFDRSGKKALHYSKVHTCDFGDEARLSQGDDFYVCELDIGSDTIKVGSMICYDREFPESARILMLKGAEIILVPNACPMEINRLSQLRARAYENMLGIATCNYPGGKPDCNGHSSAFDGIAYKEGVTGSCDTCILEAGEDEGIYIAEFDMEGIRDYRQREVHGNAYRRPWKYSLILSQEKNEPFKRDDFRK